MSYRISLNGTKLSLIDKPGFVRQNKDPFIESFSISDARDQSSLDVDSKVFGPFIYGIGRKEVPTLLSKDLTQYQMYYDGVFDGRWPTGAVAALLKTATTHTGIERFFAFIDFKGELLALATDTDVTADLIATSFTPGSPGAWGSNSEIFNGASNTVTGLDMIVHKNVALALFARNNVHVAYFSTDGDTWTAATTAITAGLLSDNVTDNEEIDGGKFGDSGNGNLYAFIWEEANNVVALFSSSDAGVNWSNEGLDIASGGGVKGVVVARGPDGKNHLILFLREGIWDVEVGDGTGTPTATFLTDSPLSAHQDNGRNAVNHGGEVWFSQGVSTNDTFQVYRMFVRDSQWQFTPVEGSPHLRDGLPTDMLGTVTEMAVSGGFCYIAVGGGAASRNATVFCHTGLGWHPLAQISTANRIIYSWGISAETDGRVRLHFNEKVGTDDDTPQILEFLNSHPNSALSIPREASSQIQLPIIDGGMPNTPAIWLQVRGKIDALDGTQSGEHVEVLYGKDGEVPTANSDLGNGLADDGTHDQNDFYSNAKVLEWIADASTPFTVPKGVNSVAMGLDLVLKAVTPATPVVKAIELDYLKIPGDIDKWDLEVDLAATEQETSGLKPPAVVALLRLAKRNSVLVEFTDNNEDTVYVHIDRIEERLLREPIGAIGTGISTNVNQIIVGGTVKVAISQVIT